MILFLWYYLHACATLGVTPLPVAVLPPWGAPVWAKVCNSCEVRRVEVNTALALYNNALFTRIVAEHEACHIFLGHDGKGLFDEDEKETETRRCTEEHFWTSFETERAAALEAQEWDERRN